VAVVSDVFDAVLGQPRAVAAMRHHAARPVHAYLFSGPAGSGVRESLRAFAAALQCQDQGCGNCESCRLALSDNDPDVTTLEREGLSWRVRELQEAERLARRTPLGDGHTIVVIEEVDLAVAAGPALLKILEEPPRRTIFLLTADLLPPALGTVLSRCVEIAFSPISEEVIAEYLVKQGAEPVAARTAASAAGGDLRRAQVLSRDEALTKRLALWLSVPERLNGVNARAGELADELKDAVTAAQAPLVALQEEEMERLSANAKELGLRAVPHRKEIEDRYRREQRRFRVDDLRFGLAALTDAYRQRMVGGLESIEDGDGRGRSTTRGAISAIELVDAAARQLSANADESLLLGNLLIALSSC
jgi:DNA polymerase III subunit delta'